MGRLGLRENIWLLGGKNREKWEKKKKYKGGEGGKKQFLSGEDFFFKPKGKMWFHCTSAYDI